MSKQYKQTETKQSETKQITAETASGQRSAWVPNATTGACWLQMLPSCRLPGHSQVLQGLLFRPRLPGYRMYHPGNPEDGNFSPPKARPLDSISYTIFRKSFSEFVSLTHAHITRYPPTTLHKIDVRNSSPTTNDLPRPRTKAGVPKAPST